MHGAKRDSAWWLDIGMEISITSNQEALWANQAIPNTRLLIIDKLNHKWQNKVYLLWRDLHSMQKG